MAERFASLPLRRCRALFATVALLASLAIAAATGPDAQPLPWSQLTPAQQQALAGSHDHWNKLSPERQHRLAKGAARWQQMTPDQRRKAQANAQRWQHMTPQQQLAVMDSYQHFHSLPPDQRKKLQTQYQHYRTLPPDQRQKAHDCLRHHKHGDQGSCDTLIAHGGADSSTAAKGAVAAPPTAPEAKSETSNNAETHPVDTQAPAVATVPDVTPAAGDSHEAGSVAAPPADNPDSTPKP
jgi:hypothetical protein